MSLVAGDGQERTVKSIIQEFDAHKAECFLEDDKQRLLAIVETAFGTLNDFNHSVRSALSLVKVVRRSIDIITGKSALDP